MRTTKSYNAITVFCRRCKQQMSCPRNAAVIQCTNLQCAMIQDPYFEYDITCDCGHCLTHPISARIIRCPLCSTFIDVSDPRLPCLELVEHKSKKRKWSDAQMDDQDTSDSNTTVSNQSMTNETYGTKPNRKRQKISSIEMYEEQWIEYQSSKTYGVRPNRPLKNNATNLNRNDDKHIHCNTPPIKHTQYDFATKSKHNKSKYGSFKKLTPITFI
eukprot:564551_1